MPRHSKQWKYTISKHSKCSDCWKHWKVSVLQTLIVLVSVSISWTAPVLVSVFEIDAVCHCVAHWNGTDVAVWNSPSNHQCDPKRTMSSNWDFPREHPLHSIHRVSDLSICALNESLERHSPHCDSRWTLLRVREHSFSPFFVISPFLPFSQISEVSDVDDHVIWTILSMEIDPICWRESVCRGSIRVIWCCIHRH